MKAFLVLFWLAGAAAAAPYLTCDPYPPNADANLNVVSFVLTGIAANPVTVQAMVGTSGSQNLYYDLALLTNNTYTVTAAAVNGYSLESPQSLPFTFQKGVPSAPTGLKIIQSIPTPLL
jgi:hypothetical protein